MLFWFQRSQDPAHFTPVANSKSYLKIKSKKKAGNIAQLQSACLACALGSVLKYRKREKQRERKKKQ